MCKKIIFFTMNNLQMHNIASIKEAAEKKTFLNGRTTNRGKGVKDKPLRKITFFETLKKKIGH